MLIWLAWSVVFANLYCATDAAPVVSPFSSKFISDQEVPTLSKVENVGQSRSTLPAVVGPPLDSASHGRSLLENGRQMEGSNGVFLHMIIMAVAAIASAMVMMSESGTGNALSGRGPTGPNGGGGAVHIYMNSNGSKRRRKNTASTPKPQGRRNKLKVRKRRPINTKDTYPLGGTPGSATGPKVAPKPQAPDPTTGFPRGKPKPLN